MGWVSTGLPQCLLLHDSQTVGLPSVGSSVGTPGNAFLPEWLLYLPQLGGEREKIRTPCGHSKKSQNAPPPYYHPDLKLLVGFPACTPHPKHQEKQALQPLGLHVN